MVENIHDGRAAIKDAVATLSLEKSHCRKKIPVKHKSTVRKQVKNIYEKSKACRPDLFESKKKYNKTIMRSRKKESTKNLKNEKMEKSKRSKIIKKEINGTSTVKHKKSSKAKLRISKNTPKNNKLLGLKKKDVQGKRNVKEAKRKLKVKDPRKKITPLKKVQSKNPSKKNVKLYKKKNGLKTCGIPKNKNGANGIKQINKPKIVNRINSIDMTEEESEGLEIIQVIADVHRIETEKDILRIDTNCDETYSKDKKRTDFPKEFKTDSSFEIDKLESKFKDIVNEVHKRSYTSLYDNIKRKERKSSQLAMNNQLTENKSSKSMKRKLTVSSVNENRSKKCNIKKPKLSKYMSKKS